MAQTLNVNKLILRGGTSSEWSAANPVLLKNEVGIERYEAGKHKIKIGDGVTSWNNLPYYDSTPTKVSDVHIGLTEPTDDSMLWIKTNCNSASGNGITASPDMPVSGAMIWIKV
nr:MAG TPA: hyaluronidase [Caudoviricetes sp.]